MVLLVEGCGPVPRRSAHGPVDPSWRGAASPRPATRVTAEQVTDAILGGAWVVDLRDAAAYARAHLPGSVNVGWSTQFSTHVGWLVPWADDVVLLTDDPEVLEPAIRDLADIGFDAVDLHVVGDVSTLTASYRRSDWAGFRAAAAGLAPGSPGAPVLLDVRQRDEHEEGHVVGALHVAVQDVEDAAATLPAGELWVHCRSGYRAGIAASLLQRAGRRVVHVDDAWENAVDLDVRPGWWTTTAGRRDAG